jgi:site-specific DNA-methyltransferase (adenine-specific)
MRLKALNELKFKEIPVIIADEWTEEQKAEFLIKDNVGFGEWDWDSLANEWDVEKLDDWGLDLPVDLSVQEELEAEEDNYEIPNEINTDIVLGDLFEIGEHRLLCGDSTDSDSVARLMDGSKADMVFTDPPYNVDYEGKTKEKLKIQNDKHSLSEFRMFMSDVISNLVIFTKKGGSYYVCIPLEVGVTDLFLEKTHLQSVLIWLKNVIVMGRKDYQQKTEPILFLTNQEEETEHTEEETYEGIVYGWNFGDSHKYYGGRKQTNVWNFDKPQRNGEHPTMKPILLVAKAINNSSKIENIIMDLFLGSGSTMVASHQLKRKCYGMELDPKYCQVIINRMKKLDPSLVIKRNGITVN